MQYLVVPLLLLCGLCDVQTGVEAQVVSYVMDPSPPEEYNGILQNFTGCAGITGTQRSCLSSGLLTDRMRGIRNMTFSIEARMKTYMKWNRTEASTISIAFKFTKSIEISEIGMFLWSNKSSFTGLPGVTLFSSESCSNTIEYEEMDIPTYHESATRYRQNIHISSVESAQYLCLVFDFGKSNDLQSFFLGEVVFCPLVKLAFEAINPMNPPSSLNLTCYLSFPEEVSEWKWYGPTGELETNDTALDSMNQRSSVTIDYLKYTDAGKYMCEVKLKRPVIKSILCDQSFKIEIPVALESVGEVVINDSVDLVVLKCEMYGYIREQQDLLWTRNGDTLSNTSRITVHYEKGDLPAQKDFPTNSIVAVLTIFNPNVTDTGDYACEVNGTEVTAVSSLRFKTEETNPTPTLASTPMTTTPGPNGSSSLAGAIAGAVFGAILCIVLVVFLIFLLYCLCWKYRTAPVSKRATSKSHMDYVDNYAYSPKDLVSAPISKEQTSMDYVENYAYSPKDVVVEMKGQASDEVAGDAPGGVQLLATTNTALLERLPSVKQAEASAMLAVEHNHPSKRRLTGPSRPGKLAKFSNPGAFGLELHKNLLFEPEDSESEKSPQIKSKKSEPKENGTAAPLYAVVDKSRKKYKKVDIQVVQTESSPVPSVPVSPVASSKESLKPIDDEPFIKRRLTGPSKPTRLSQLKDVTNIVFVGNPLYIPDEDSPTLTKRKPPKAKPVTVTEENAEALYSDPYEPDIFPENPSDSQCSSIYAEPMPIRKSIVPLAVTEDNIEEIKVLGVGQFGEVILARTVGLSLKDLGLSVKDDDRSINVEVAVKRLQKDSDESVHEAFEKEIKFMSQLKDENVVCLLALSMSDNPFIIMEYMKNGDLNQFLQRYETVSFMHAESSTDITAFVLVHVAMQIASGMCYLANFNFIHRDLATRNCLVGENHLVKISDFGMSRNLYESAYYKVRGRAMLPIRWMASECFYGKFSEKSDIWSLGITMWEMFTLSKLQPYSHLDDHQMIEDATGRDKGRELLQKPDCCPPEVYDVMLWCWMYDPVERPTFKEVFNALSAIEGQLFNE